MYSFLEENFRNMKFPRSYGLSLCFKLYTIFCKQIQSDYTASSGVNILFVCINTSQGNDKPYLDVLCKLVHFILFVQPELSQKGWFKI